MKKLMTAFIAFFICQTAFALSLGKAELQSSLSQAFKAEVELYNLEDLTEDDIMVSLASNKNQIAMGVEPNSIHRDLKFKIIETDNTLKLLITSRSPIREPFIEMVIQAKWPKGEIRRKYTFTLDLPSSQR